MVAAVVPVFNASSWEAEAGGPEFGAASLVYSVSSGTARAIQGIPCLEKGKKDKGEKRDLE